MNTFFDWNIALNSEGGPNHAQNFCEAPILCNVEKGTFEKRLSYDYIWHFSHFIDTGAVHLSTTTFSTEIDAAAFQNLDGSIVAVLLNNASISRHVYLRMNNHVVEVPLQADSIATLVIDR